MPPLAQLPVAPIGWDRQLLPEFLWVASLRAVAPVGEIHRPFYAFMDALDEFWSDDEVPHIGLISDFGHVGESQRREFLENCGSLVEELVLGPFGKALALYPSCPASWLLPDSFDPAAKAEDREEGVALLRGLIVDLFNPRGDLATAAKLASFGRMLKHGKVLFPRGFPTADLLPKYPDRCTPDERSHVESFVRATMSTVFSMREERLGAWAPDFWRHNTELAPCLPKSLEIRSGREMGNEELREFSELLERSSSRARSYVTNLPTLLRFDLFEPERQEVLAGVFSRCVRMYCLLIEGGEIWARDVAGIVLRCLAEAAITFCYLARRGTGADYAAFRDYGDAQLKLHMLHLQEEYPGEQTIDGMNAEDLSELIGGGFAAELLEIELGSWSKKSARDLALQAGVDRLYRLVFSPTSGDVHGNWASLRVSNLAVCAEPLHRFHWLPSVSEPPLSVQALATAEELMEEVYMCARSELGYPEGMELTRLRDWLAEQDHGPQMSGYNPE